jgi:hypothetical protein
MFLRLRKNLHFRDHPGRKLFGLAMLLSLSLLSTGCIEGRFRIDVKEPASTEPFELQVTKTETPTPGSSTPADGISEATVTAAPSVTVQSSTTPVSELTRTHYTLAAFLDYDRHHITVFETLSYVNTTGAPLEQIMLVIEPEYRTSDFQLNSLKWQDGADVDRYTLEDGLLQVDLDRNLDSWEVLELEMAFEYTLPDQPGSLGYSQRQANLADWYAMAPPYSPGQGWMVFEPGDVGEHITYDMADYDVEIRPMGKVDNVVMAASAPARKVGNIYCYHRDNARNFSFSASPQYQLVYDAYGSTTILGYVFPEHIQAGTRAVSYVRESLEVFSELFGTNDMPSMTLVEAEFPDGLEYDALFFLSQSYFANDNESAQNGLCFLSVHETAHQWWYRSVANNQAMQPWLDEALSTYSEMLFYEQRYPQLVAWWWDYRIIDYGPQGWVDSSIYDFNEDRPYINAVYLRGARFLDELRARMGMSAFQQFLQDYAAQNANQITDEEIFFQLLSEHYPVDISDLTEQFFKK